MHRQKSARENTFIFTLDISDVIVQEAGENALNDMDID